MYLILDTSHSAISSGYYWLDTQTVTATHAHTLDTHTHTYTHTHTLHTCTTHYTHTFRHLHWLRNMIIRIRDVQHYYWPHTHTHTHITLTHITHTHTIHTHAVALAY
jgi:hypothetical protein